MKKQVLAVAAFAAVLFGTLATPSFAFQSVKIATLTAVASVGGTKTADFSVAIRATDDPFGADRSSITFSGIDPSRTKWKLADDLVVINATVTDAGGGIRTYTDNTAADAVPTFVDPTPGNLINPDSNASGLLEGVAGTTSRRLAMAWSIKSSTKQIENSDPVNGIGAADPRSGGTGFNAGTQYLFMRDKKNFPLGIDYNNNGVTTDVNIDQPASADDAPYLTMVRVSGIHTGSGNFQFQNIGGAGTNAFVYYEADFTNASAQTAYQTSTLRIEAFIQ